MALILNEEQTMLRDSALAFIGENAPVAERRRLRDGHDATGFSPALPRYSLVHGLAYFVISLTLHFSSKSFKEFI